MTLLQEAVAYARAEDEEAARPLFEAARAYITGATDHQDEEDPRFRLAVCMLFAHWYDNREAAGKAERLTYGLQCILSQLQNGGGT